MKHSGSKSRGSEFSSILAHKKQTRAGYNPLYGDYIQRKRILMQQAKLLQRFDGYSGRAELGVAGANGKSPPVGAYNPEYPRKVPMFRVYDKEKSVVMSRAR